MRKKKTNEWDLPSIQRQMEIIKAYPEWIERFDAKDWSIGSQYILITQIQNIESILHEYPK